MSNIPNKYELKVLEMLDGKIELTWGAWVGACLEFLSKSGYCTRGPKYKITDKGRSYLEENSLHYKGFQ